ncbi:MAG: OadG family transporter subunit [Bacteroidota bacterium]
MPADLQTALIIMAVGMATVFVVLGMVVLTGRVLIRVLNRYAPAPPSPAPRQSPSAHSPSPSPGLSPQVVAALVATVEQVTGGRGRIEKIESEP